MLNKRQESLPLPATLRPGSFPLGSPESRAAARAMLAAREAEATVIHVVVEHIGGDIEPNPAIDRLKRHIEIEAVPAPSNGDEAAPAVPVPLDETEHRPVQSIPQPSLYTVPPPPASQSNEVAIMPPRTKARPMVGAVGYLEGIR